MSVVNSAVRHPIYESGRPVLWAHRGCCQKALENTMEAFEHAAALRADGIELDVRTSADGVAIVLHDQTLTRVSNGTYRDDAHELPWRVLRTRPLRNGAYIPRLSEVLDWSKSHSLALNIELKHDCAHPMALVNAVAKEIARTGVSSARVIVSSFDPRLLVLAQLFMPKIAKALIFSRNHWLSRSPLLPFFLHMTRSFAAHPERTVCSPKAMQAWKRAGRVICPWSVNHGEEAADLTYLGASGFITDDIAQLQQSPIR